MYKYLIHAKDTNLAKASLSIVPLLQAHITQTVQ